MIIFLKGNLSDGFVAFGPYSDFDVCAETHNLEEGWMMELKKQDFGKCPNCDSDDTVAYGINEFGTQDVSCNNCSAYWQETWVLAGIANLTVDDE